MPKDDRQRRSFRFNLELVLEGLIRWPVATAVVLIGLGALVVVQAFQEGRTDPAYIAVSILAVTSAVLFMKGLFYLMAYPFLKKSPFPGSYFAATRIVLIPWFVFGSCGFYLLGVQQGKPVPLAAIVILFVIAYPLFSIFFGGFLRANEWVQLNKEEYLRRARYHRPPQPPKPED